jgi:hypothetical protein
VSSSRSTNAAHAAGVGRGLAWCAAVLGLVVLVMVAELSAPSAGHPMVPGWWVPPVVLLFAGTIRVGYCVAAGRRVGVPGWLSPACLMLPPDHRTDWLLLVAGVLHAEQDRAGRRRQVTGFLAALPVTMVAGWTCWLQSRFRSTSGTGS